MAPLPVIEIGSDGSPTSELIATLYVAALQAKDEPATVVDVEPGTETLALADNSPMAMPVFAGTLLQEASTDTPPTDAATTISDLADQVAPEVSLLQTSHLDGALGWVATPESGLTSLTQLAGLPAGTTVVAPGFAMTIPSGVPALRAAYDAQLTVDQIDDPSQREAAVSGGQAAAGLFRRIDLEISGLVHLDDPVGVAAPDPLVAAVSAEFAEQRPDAVLVLDAVQAQLTDESYVELAAAAAADGLEPAVSAWLQARGLA